MCGSMVDIQSWTVEIRRGKKRRKKKPQDESIISASATQGGHKNAIISLTVHRPIVIIRLKQRLAKIYNSSIANLATVVC